MKKNTVVAVSITALIIFLGIAGYFVLNKEQKTVISEIPAGETTGSADQQIISNQNPEDIQTDTVGDSAGIVKTVSLGDEITLGENETVILNQPEVSIKVVRFINSPCPSGVQCIWSGQAVSFELRVGDKVYKAPMGTLSSDAPYDVTVKSTDYKTFATFVINSK